VDYLALRTAILANADCQPHIVTNEMPKQDARAKDQAIADILNAPAGTRLVDQFETAISLMAHLGAVTGATILDKLETASAAQPVLKWAMLALKSERGINVGDPDARGMIEQLAAGNVLTQAEADALLALAVRTSSLAYAAVGKPVTGADVSVALRFNAEFTGG
jgi:hypothetical protein